MSEGKDDRRVLLFGEKAPEETSSWKRQMRADVGVLAERVNYMEQVLKQFVAQINTQLQRIDHACLALAQGQQVAHRLAIQHGHYTPAEYEATSKIVHADLKAKMENAAHEARKNEGRSASPETPEGGHQADGGDSTQEAGPRPDPAPGV